MARLVSTRIANHACCDLCLLCDVSYDAHACASVWSALVLLHTQRECCTTPGNWDRRSPTMRGAQHTSHSALGSTRHAQSQSEVLNSTICVERTRSTCRMWAASPLTQRAGHQLARERHVS